MQPINIPLTYNYIGVFLTFACNLACSYCINYFETNLIKRKIISGEDWVRLLNRINSRPDLPVTLQGGEPTLHPDFIYIVNNLKPQLHIDVLTNLMYDIDRFMQSVDPQRIKRSSPYASIRVSYHPETMKLNETVEKVLKLLDKGYSVGIWSVLHPYYKEHILKAQAECQAKGIDFRTKEFLGEYKNILYGTYKYEGSCSKKALNKKALCKTTEFLIDSQSDIFRCHHDLYSGVDSIGSLYDGDFQIQDIFRPCDYFGFCNPCDVKVKTNRFQKFGHTSVDIKFPD